MRHYETIYIIHPDLTDEEVAGVADKYGQLLKDQQAELVKLDVWGRRKLAYEIKKCSKGYYVELVYGAEAPAVAELERRFKIDDQILRFLTVKLSDNFDPARIASEADRKAAVVEDDEDAPGRPGLDRDSNDDDDDDRPRFQRRNRD